MLVGGGAGGSGALRASGFKGSEHAHRIARQHVMFFQGEADAALEFTHGAVLLGRLCLEDYGKDKLRAFERVNAQNLRIGDEEVFELRQVADFHGDGVQDAEDLVGVGGKVNAHADGAYAVVDDLVGDGGDLRIGYCVKGSIGAADRGLAQRHGFHCAGEACDDDDVAHVELILNQDDGAIEHILDQVLRGQSDGDAGDSCRGEQGAEVDA